VQSLAFSCLYNNKKLNDLKLYDVQVDNLSFTNISSFFSKSNHFFEFGLNTRIFFIALQSKVEQINDSTSLIYPILLWLNIVLISFVVMTSL